MFLKFIVNITAQQTAISKLYCIFTHIQYCMIATAIEKPTYLRFIKSHTSLDTNCPTPASIPVTTLGILDRKLLTVLTGTPSVSSWRRVTMSSIYRKREERVCLVSLDCIYSLGFLHFYFLFHIDKIQR